MRVDQARNNTLNTAGSSATPQINPLAEALIPAPVEPPVERTPS